MRTVLLFLLCCLLLGPTAARAERVLLTPISTQGGASASGVDAQLRRFVSSLGSVELVGRDQTADVLASLACDGTLGCTVARGVKADATAVVLGRIEQSPDAVRVVMSLIDVPTQSERSRVEVDGAAGDAERLVQAAAVQLLAPDRYVGALRVVMAETGAEVWVDGNLVGTTPLLAAVSLAPTRHEVEVRLAGIRPFRRFVDIRFDQPVTLELAATPTELVEQAAALPSPAPAPVAHAAGPSPFLVGGAIAAGTGVAAIGTGAVLGVLALQSKQRWESGEGDRNDVRANRIQSPLSAALLGAGAVLLLGGGAALAATFLTAPPADQ